MKWLSHCLAASLICAGAAAHAQDYPSKPINIVVPFTPGGVTDVMTRQIAAKLQSDLGQPVVVVNKPGAGTMIASAYVAKAPADGYTLLMAASSLGIAPSLYKTTANYDPVKDFQPVSLIASVPHVLVTGKQLQASSVKELIATLKKDGKSAAFASSGNGTSNHLEGELFAALTGLKMTHIPYKGSVPALTSLAGGEVDLLFVDIAAAQPFLDSGKVRPLAVTTKTRSSVLPELPTVEESGLPGYDAMPWLGIVAPAGTPPAVVERLQVSLQKMKAASDVQEQFKKMGLDPLFTKPADFGAFIVSDSAKWAELIKKSGATAE
ncbi:ABC transporter substrate-binding protein [Achromobacter insolitus]|uniref:Bug family tripartite tricarboxylate transporter substrate binding protein n=1 Tax=Achromobacter insolitus TaxID=217204 RepID=UPI000DD1110E|nr:tripartite tricarboxylate transporter substrate binding protein [Achromobacter insolitus]AXA74468.1 ABC transporter substrate-binding protein [Achromobacter insolitus]